MNCGWHGSIDDLVQVSGEEIIRSLIAFYQESAGENPAATQTGAWEDSLSFLREQFELLRDMQPESDMNEAVKPLLVERCDLGLWLLRRLAF